MKGIRLTIRKKTMAVIIVLASILIAVSMVFYVHVIRNDNSTHYKQIATDLSETVARIVDTEQLLRIKTEVENRVNSAPNMVLSDKWGSDEWNEYTARFDDIQDNPDFIALRDSLRRIQDVNDVDCIYLSYVDTEHALCVYVVDAAYEDACPPGCLDPLYDVNKELLTNPAQGFPAYITDTEEYGWLVTAGAPIYSGDTVIGYAMTDVSMTEIQTAQRETVIHLLVYQFIALTLISVAGILFVNFSLIKPLKTLTDAASKYGKETSDGGTRSLFSKLNIKTRDEIGELAKSMRDMEKEINHQIEELYLMNNRLAASRSIASEMTELANTDALTGVRSKTAYDIRIKQLDDDIQHGKKVEFGIAMIDLNVLKGINDNYGHSAGDKAIIHVAGVAGITFSRSDVYRVGGDEFAVILQDKDYENAEQLRDEFLQEVGLVMHSPSSDESYRISASIGYAIFDSKTDSSVLDVFKRADKAMYECKHGMKS